MLKQKKMQQNSKCRLFDDTDETINHIISECSKLAQKEYKTRHDWVGKVIHYEWWEINRSHILVRKPDLGILKRTCWIMDFAVWQTTDWKSKKTKRETTT